MHKFRFGVVGESVRDAAGLLDTARRAERLGYDTFLLRDHFVTEPFGDQLSPLVALTAAAAATDSIRLGTLVLANDYRHPVLLAKEAATLDHLSGGRFELGIGAGWLRAEYEAAGLSFDPAGERVGRLEEALTLLDGLLSGRTVDQVGEHYAVRGLATFPVPARRPPLLVGAGGPRMLRMAGRLADTVGILPIATPQGGISEALSERSAEAMARKTGWVRESGRDVELSQMITVDVGPSHRELAERVARSRGWDADLVLDMPSKFLGTHERIADQLRERRERFGLSYHVVSDRDLDAFAPVVAELSGT
ncbi:TIGR03621 family F420-dependent LLM class oxidoreductase [Amycolatopsis suaedae]|uniref:TIGR03621 family F420-dependent LLM class oxidoreductase n=1 Tax=Amycolatopsis suaedae TaxID=2510978 RepID=A0A4Q7JD46_9PSEU|nr:TIGR03621 family F420-dependent LLM class oxidoreductase [Amycolatopsis suaedae]RZQ64523.1 TIGR03621 family F420-dependent LLM class oxidoreductase [Amycolatopsis suaedae]